MFTGIVETVGAITSVNATPEGVDLTIACGPLVADARVGDSVAVNGACLTITAIGDDAFVVHAVPETMSRTNLGDARPGSSVNLERAALVGGRLDGHIVQGHVDGTARVRSMTPEGAGSRMTFDLPARLARYVVEKGSICVDGVSLTVAALDDDSFAVALIPHTLGATTLGARSEGDLVNLEVDVLAKYVERLMKGAP